MNRLQAIWELLIFNEQFLKELKQICEDEKIVLIFDEVMTGFRVAKGGAPGNSWSKTRFNNLRKNYWRRFTGRCFRRKKRNYGNDFSQRTNLSGRNIKRKPIGNGCIAALTYIKEHPEIYKLLEDKSKFLEDGFLENMKSLGKEYSFKPSWFYDDSFLYGTGCC